MRHYLNFKIAFLFLFISTITCAQKEIAVIAVNKQMSRGEQPGYQVTIPGAKLKDITTAYRKQLEQNTKADAKEIGGELVNYGAVNKNFSSKPFTVFSKFLETPDGVDMWVFVTEDSVNFISEKSDNDKQTALKKSIHDFAVTEYKKNVSKKFDVENDKLNDLKKDLEKKVDAESDNIKSISKKQREIENYNIKIEDNKKSLVTKTEDISRQKKTVSEISDRKSPEYDLASKNLKSIQSDKKSLEKESEKMARNIDDNNAEIKELENKNIDLTKQQDSIKEKIEAQESVVKSIEQELNGIK